MSNALAPARSRSHSSPDIRTLGVAPLLTPADLTAAWGVAADTVTALLWEDAWRFGDLPVPMWIGPGSEHGPGWGRPRFVPHAVVKFLTERAVAAGIVPPPAPPVDVRLVLLDTRELAHVLAVPYDTLKKWAADRRWDVDEMPTPIRVCRGSGGTLEAHQQGGLRRWRSVDVIHWIEVRTSRRAAEVWA